MAFDNYTVHKYRACGDGCPGRHRGEIFEATEDAGDVLVSVGAAERLPDDAPKEKGVYKRRDLRAER